MWNIIIPTIIKAGKVHGHTVKLTGRNEIGRELCFPRCMKLALKVQLAINMIMAYPISPNIDFKNKL